MKKKICIREYHLQCSRTLGKPGKLRLAFLTDLHNRTEGEEGERIWELLDSAAARSCSGWRRRAGGKAGKRYPRCSGFYKSPCLLVIPSGMRTGITNKGLRNIQKNMVLWEKYTTRK